MKLKGAGNVQYAAWVNREVESIEKRATLLQSSNPYFSGAPLSINFGAGFGPSGFPHIGTLCEVIRTDLIKNHIKARLNCNTRLYIVSDDMDALRKIPENFPNKELLKRYIGCPLCQIPDPFNTHRSFSENINQRLINLLDEYNLDYEFVRSHQAYKAGEYNSTILLFLKQYEAINNVIKSSLGAIRKGSYSIFMPISPFSGRIIEHINILETNLKSGEITFEIPRNAVILKPGGSYSIRAEEYYLDEPIGKPITVSVLNGGCKLQWKADWAMRLIHRNILYQMHGEDLANSVCVVREIFNHLNISSPIFFRYGLFRDEYGGKISKSKGNGFTLAQASRFLTQEALRTFLTRNPVRSCRFGPGFSPTINDSSTFPFSRNSKAMRYTKIARILDACSPLTPEQACFFLSRYADFSSLNKEQLDKSWVYYREYLFIRRTIFSPNQKQRKFLFALKEALVAMEQKSASEHLPIFIRSAALAADFSLNEAYKTAYLALTNKDSGPRLSTYIQIIGTNAGIMLISECLSRTPKGSVVSANDDYQSKISSFKRARTIHKTQIHTIETPMQRINFDAVMRDGHRFARLLTEKADQIAESLSAYECYHVAMDEIERSVEFLENLHVNQEYFHSQIRGVTSFLPLNQPLYATVCFGIVPSFLARDVSIRPPTAMHAHYRRLASAIDLEKNFVNLTISYDDKEVFLAKRIPVTDAVIFTGTPENGNKVRRYFLKDVLFILNGAGHNPLVISESADVGLALESALRVVLYNQGQDCAGPNAILVHKNVYQDFQRRLISSLEQIQGHVGSCHLRDNIVGPNTDIDHGLKVIKLFKEQREFCIYGGEINPITGLIKPTIFSKPLVLGGNYKEFFAPVFYLQEYNDDQALSQYFEHPSYHPHAMYISVFGESRYIQSLADGKSHSADSIIWNSDLHLEEKGYLPYGGLGPAASCLYVNGNRVPGATLPQCDIYSHLVEPTLRKTKTSVVSA